MNKKIFIVLILLIFIFDINFKIFADDKPEPWTALFTEVNGRAVGMGDAFTAVADDASASYYNPAGLANLSQPEFLLMKRSKDFDVEQNFTGGSIPVGTNNSVGVNFFQDSIGQIEKWVDDPTCTDLTNVNCAFDGTSYYRFVGTFGDKQSVYRLSYGTKLNKNLSAGISLKLFKESLDTASAKGMGFDIGFLYQKKLENSKLNYYSLGVIFQDITQTKIKWSGTATNPTFNVPVNYRLGIALAMLQNNLIISTDWDKRTNLHFGTEYWINPIFALRIGSNDKKLTAGASIKLSQVRNSYQIDYAYENDKDLFGNSSMLSVKILF